MIRPLSYEEILFDFNMDGVNISDIDYCEFIEYKNIYDSFKRAININHPSFNIFLIDKISEEKIEKLMEVIKDNAEDRQLYDFAYAVFEDEKKPELMIFKAGYGKKVEKYVKEIKEIYADLVFEFYNTTEFESKDEILSIYLKQRNQMLKELSEKSKKNNFNLVCEEDNFSFIPVINGENMTEEEFDALDIKDKEKILNSLKKLKQETKDIINKLKNLEDKYLDQVENTLDNFLEEKTKEIKERCYVEFKNDDHALDFLLRICHEIKENLINNISKNMEELEKLFVSIFYKYRLKVIVKNMDKKIPIIYEKDPSYKNLFGSIEYISKSGVYTSDIEKIETGSLLKANGGYLIINIEDLLGESSCYYELKRTLKNEKYKFDDNKSILSLLSPENFRLEEIPVDVKVILVGSYKYYNLLYNYDDDFKKLFKIYLESDPVIPCNKVCKEELLKSMLNICKKYKCKPLTNKAIKEVARIFAKKAERRDKIDFNYEKLKDMMILSTAYAVDLGKRGVMYDDIVKVYRKDSLLQKYLKEQYKNGKIILNLRDNRVGEINGLSVIEGTGIRLGRPLRITCTCSKGNGSIIDIQKENSLSGKIHNKSISILKGLLTNLVGGYNEIPVDFNVSFEQIYGEVEGDSASVAEMLVIISSLLKVPIRQNIAVTGSINQFGDVQPIGGVNDKIEGFFDVCNTLDTASNKGVLIPWRNFNNIVLKREVEEAIGKQEFYIYTMENIFDAMELMFEEGSFRNNNIVESIQREVRRYSGKRDRK